MSRQLSKAEKKRKLARAQGKSTPKGSTKK